MASHEIELLVGLFERVTVCDCTSESLVDILWQFFSVINKFVIALSLSYIQNGTWLHFICGLDFGGWRHFLPQSAPGHNAPCTAF